MTGPLGASTDITGSRTTKAAFRRELADRINAAGRRAGITLGGYQVRSLMATLTAAHEDPTETDVYVALMAAPWFPKARIRRYRVGDSAWRTTA